MLETWRWPKASLRVLSMSSTATPRRAGGVAIDDDDAFESVHLLVGIDVAQLGDLARRC